MANPAVKTINLDASIGSTGDVFKANRLVNINLNNRTLTGDLKIETDLAGTINLSAGTGGKIVGNLVVNAQNATVNNSIPVESGSIIITDVALGTWNENADNNTIIVNDSTGVTLNIGEGKTVSSLTLNQPTTVTVPTGSTITTLDVKAPGSKVSNNGTVTTLQADAPVAVEGKVPTNVTGSAAGDVEVSVKVDSKQLLLDAIADTKITEIVVDGTIGSTNDFGEFNIERALTIKGATNNSVYGTFNVKSTGVTLEGLNLFVRGGSTEPASLKTGINILTNQATVKNNVLELINPNNVDVGNGLAIWSTTPGDTQFNISGNTFKSFEGNSPGWSSTAILIVEGLDMARFGMAGTTSAEITVNDKLIATGNSYVGGTYAYMHHNYAGNNAGVSYGYARTSGNLGAIIRDASEGATVLLANDIERGTDITVTKNVKLTGGYKVTLTGEAKITVETGKQFTIDAETTVEGTITGEGTWTGKETVEEQVGPTEPTTPAETENQEKI
ncbi:hypothetical protein SporoP33_11845 [Sporosarcina sp. P33]|nr:hypothetical protein SporoP33_11845 [Sporosarcina sp. P33]